MLDKTNIYNFGLITMFKKINITGLMLSLTISLMSLAQEPVDSSFTKDSSKRALDDIVITGTLKEVKRMESPVPVEVYREAFLRKNPSFHLFEGLMHINGVRPQSNCNICNAGDIRINGLPGPYTMVLIDGMPIMSSLSSVYGLSGIPVSMIERIEVVKGPASTLYGSEAIGGLIHIITKNAGATPKLSLDAMSSTWGEVNTDLGITGKVGKKVRLLTGINFSNYAQPRDNNGDGFTDLSLQQRLSVFQKWSFQQKNNNTSNIAVRYLYEDRWGGEMKWNKSYRGTDQLYGESIITNRLELIGNYVLPVREKLMLSYSLNHHHQNSVYGLTKYIGKQQIGFAQFTWNKKIEKHDLLIGSAFRYTYYVDNTPATGSTNPLALGNAPQQISLPGIFIQDEISFGKNHKLLLGMRYDRHHVHGGIYTPRFAYKYSISKNQILRLNGGTGFRVVNIFTEDHAALSGARIVEMNGQLNPERSQNININYLMRIMKEEKALATIDLTAFYTYFNNRIIGDYDKDPNKIIYENLNGYAVSKGISLNADISLIKNLKLSVGGTMMDVTINDGNTKEQQILTERFSGTWTVSYRIPSIHIDIDYTGNVFSPMRLPLLGALDPRKPFSPWYSLQNIQVVFHRWYRMEIYGGVKNILNFQPHRFTPFLIARPQDPFDKGVKYDAEGRILSTPDNPFALSFDPTYMYAPNQGIRGFLGMRYTLK